MFQVLVHTRDCPQGRTALGGRVPKLRVHNPLRLKVEGSKQSNTDGGKRRKQGPLCLRGPQAVSKA